jgi:hypothetical protein
MGLLEVENTNRSFKVYRSVFMVLVRRLEKTSSLLTISSYLSQKSKEQELSYYMLDELFFESNLCSMYIFQIFFFNIYVLLECRSINNYHKELHVRFGPKVREKHICLVTQWAVRRGPAICYDEPRGLIRLCQCVRRFMLKL